MMIHKDDVRSTLRAWDPTTTEEQIDALYQEMDEAWQQEATRLEFEVATAYEKKTGHPLDGMSRGQLINQTKQMAKDLVYGEYLEPIYQQIAERAAEEAS